MGIYGNSPKKQQNVPQNMEQKTLSDGDNNTSDDENRNKTETERKDDDNDIDGVCERETLDLKSKTKAYKKTATEYFKKFLSVSFGESPCLNLKGVVDKNSKLATFLEGETILRSGEESCGLFTIVNGTANESTADDSLIVEELSTGDVFGDISTVFRLPCTTNIKAVTDIIAVVIEPEAAFELFKDHADHLDVIDWCVQHRYLPIGEVIEAQRVYRRLALQCLKCTSLLHAWAPEDLKKLILSFDRGIVTLYPPNATLVSIGDPVTSLLIVTRGILKIEGNNFVMTVDVSMYSKPFIYGQFCLTTDKLSPVTIKAVSFSQIIDVEKSWILGVLSNDHTKGKLFVEKTKQFDNFRQKIARYGKEFGAVLEYDIIFHYARNSLMYADENVELIERKIVNGVFEDFSVGDSVILGVENGRYEAIVVLYGRLALTETKAKSETIIPDNKPLKEQLYVDGSIFDQGSVIILCVLNLEKFRLKSVERSIVCKIRKADEVVQEKTNISESNPDKVEANEIGDELKDDHPQTPSPLEFV